MENFKYVQKQNCLMNLSVPITQLGHSDLVSLPDAATPDYVETDLNCINSAIFQSMSLKDKNSFDIS